MKVRNVVIHLNGLVWFMSYSVLPKTFLESIWENFIEKILPELMALKK